MLSRINPWLWRVLLGAALVLFFIPFSSLAGPNQARNLVALRQVKAPNPRLIVPAAASFHRIRKTVIAKCGRDYLGNLDEALRPVDYVTSKAGVANRSWHKAGRAVDVKQAYKGVVVIKDVKKRGFRRVLVRCAKQNGTQGRWYGPKGLQQRGKPGFYLDVSQLFLNEGWNRIPAQGKVSEWWHFEYRAGARNWQDAMRQVYPLRTLRKLYPGAF